MKILVVGSGGREHVLCWKLAQSKNAEKVYCAPGNAGIAQEFECVNIKVNELEKMADWAVENKIDFTVVGPEAPLCDGIVDVFKSRGLAIFGPSKAAAQLEGSKTFAKKFMEKYNIPTARAAEFDTPAPAKDYVNKEFANGEKALWSKPTVWLPVKACWLRTTQKMPATLSIFALTAVSVEPATAC